MLTLLLWVVGLYLLHWVVAKVFKKQPTFPGKVVLITGASSGIGEALAYEFSRLGAYVILSARRENELKRVQKNLAIPEKSDIFLLDLDQPSDKIQAASTDFIQKIGGKIDIAILNAGLSQRDLFSNMEVDVIERLMRVNFFSVVAMTKALVPGMVAQKSGQIAVTSSMAGLFGVAMRTGYCASKHALHGFMSALRSEVAHEGVSVQIVSPGYIQTNISQNALQGDGKAFGKTDSNIASGMPVEKAAKQFIYAVYKKVPETIISQKYPFFLIFTLLMRTSGRFASLVAKQIFKRQQRALKKAQ